MAVNLDVVEKTLEDLEKEITCAVCQEHYTDPKILPCLHCYCKLCILKLSLRVGKGKPFPCPECRKDTVLPDKGEQELKSVFIINRLKSMYLKHKKALSKKVSCEICTLAEAFCHQCDKFACKNCVHMHSVMKAAFEGHECVSIEQVQNIQTESIPKHLETKKCNTHGKRLKIFCFECNKLICRDCTVKDHKDHNIEFNNVAADKKKKELMETLKSVREMKGFLSQALNEVAEAEKEIQAQEKAETNKIEISFEKLYKIQELHRQQLLEEVKRITKGKIEKLIVYKKNLTAASEELHTVIDHTEQCVRLCSDDEVMSMHSEVANRMQTQLRELNKQQTDMESLEKADMIVEVDCADVLHQFYLGNTWISNKTITESLELQQLPDNEVYGDVKFKIYNKLGKVIPAKNLDCQVQCPNEVSSAKVHESDDNRYDVTYTPTACGLHEFQITAYGYPLLTTPFTVTAYLGPILAKESSKVWNNITHPQSIAINSHGEIVVIESDKAILVLNREGIKIRSVDIASLKINTLHRQAIDQQDNIYFTGLNSNKIGKCDRYLNNILVQDVQQVHGCGHFDIAVVRNEVLVTEYYNKGQIVVYDRNLNVIRRILTTSRKTLYYLCSDSQDNLYVSTYDNTIVALNMNGDILRSFSQEMNGVQILKDPAMIHVYGCYVYVADFLIKKTVVFTREGKYVMTFGHYGPVCVDKDGVVYNCDHSNNCVHIY